MAHLVDGRHGGARIAHMSLLVSITASVTPVIAGFLAARGQIGGVDLVALLFILSAVGRAASGVILLIQEMPGRRPLTRTRVTIPAPETG